MFPKVSAVIRTFLVRMCLVVGLLSSACALAAPDLSSLTDWIDKETGHHIRLVSQDSYSRLPYFTANIFSSDGKFFAYSSPKGIYITSLQDFSSKLLIPYDENQPTSLIELGKKYPRLYYLSYKKKDNQNYLESVDIHTLKVTRHGLLPKNYSVTSINSDETLALGLSEQSSSLPRKYKGKADKLYNRYLEKIPMTLFTMSLERGILKDIYLSTDWLSHPQFSPSNPYLIMYSLEGPWHLVDRIWTINSDGSNNQLIHRRTKSMEIAGHEYWSKDGKKILYDWQYPKGEVFYLASYDIETKQRSASLLKDGYCSVHYNSGSSDVMVVGDGENEKPSKGLCTKNSAYIFKYTLGLSMPADGDLLIKNITREPLVDMTWHDYGMLEPNVRVSADQRWVIFMSNMFGNSGVFAVFVDNKNEKFFPVLSTKSLAGFRLNRYRDMVGVR